MEPRMEKLTIPFLGRDRAGQQYPFADLVPSGARIAMSSDWSVTTANLLEQMEVAVNRIDPKNRSARRSCPSNGSRSLRPSGASRWAQRM